MARLTIRLWIFRPRSHVFSKEEGNPRSYDLSKILVEIDNFDLVKQLSLGLVDDQIDMSRLNKHELKQYENDCTCYPLVICYIAIEHGHRNSGFLWIFPLNMVIFHSFLYVYQRVFGCFNDVS